MTEKTIKASIIGVTGFTGAELLRVLLPHPNVELKYLVSRQYEAEPLANIFPRLFPSLSSRTAQPEGSSKQQPDPSPTAQDDIGRLYVTNTDHETVAEESDVVFLCLPHVASQEVCETFLGKTKLIDMSADFRLDDADTFEKYYGTKHLKPELLGGRFIYGLPELNREAIKEADAVANPGCNALLVQMMLLPFAGNIDHVDVFLLTGTTGGGRSARDPVDHPALSNNVRSYLINAHRHTPEITRTAQINAEQMNFTPTVGPFLRGIFATSFVQAKAGPNTSCFDGEPFIRLCDKVELSNVTSNNFCDLSYQEGENGVYIVQGAIDNLLRGAAGTALQNMNLMFGFDETTRLTFNSAIYP